MLLFQLESLVFALLLLGQKKVLDSSGVQRVVNSNDFVDEIEEVSDLDFVFRFLVVLFEDFLVINVDYTVLHIQLLVIHLIFLAYFT